MQAPPTRIGDEDCQSLIRRTLRQLAVGLSVYDPDQPLYDHFVSFGTQETELSSEGRRHLGELSDLAARRARELAEFEFSTIDEVPAECREALSEAREGVSELSWILWAVQVALENTQAVGEPPGSPYEALARCAWVSSQLYSTNTSRECTGTLRGRRHEE